ncbi:hypothetical protein Plec18167_007034 [Paecilomyces lecythidis]|uniref:Carboxypeptidase n=1 Tax=Paecilomyces lecythidis TaxID=3004212 RepID=A0ABR3X781_9EURO
MRASNLLLPLGTVSAISHQTILRSDLDKQIDSTFQIYQSNISPHHSLRIKSQNATLCNTTVNQYTGWLDNGHKHLFFWYFDSESKNATTAEDEQPLVLWQNGGPGASSILGLLQELGPCLINEHGNGTVGNPYSWNKENALLFVDQPVGVGFSYYDGDSQEDQPGDSYASAADMHIFLQMFVNQVFPIHRNGPLTLTGESYGGHYVPTLGAEIVRQNGLHPARPQLKLKSIAVGNPLVSFADRAFGYWETLCTTNPGVAEPVFNETRCDIMAENLPRCLEVISTCNTFPDPAICEAASNVCWDGVISHYDSEADGPPGSRNRFDTWFALSVPSAVKNYTISSDDVYGRFKATTDITLATVSSVQYLLQNQIDVLIYSGNLDLACNTAGSKRWMDAMSWKGQVAFTSKSLEPWTSIVGGNRVKAGTFKEVNIKIGGAGSKTTRFALVTIDGSGHMVPQDQPEVALDMITRWLSDGSFA